MTEDLPFNLVYLYYYY